MKQQFPPDKRLVWRQALVETRMKVAERAPDYFESASVDLVEADEQDRSMQLLDVVEPAHPDLGKLGVFWHTQGSGKSYSMAST